MLDNKKLRQGIYSAIIAAVAALGVAFGIRAEQVDALTQALVGIISVLGVGGGSLALSKTNAPHEQVKDAALEGARSEAVRILEDVAARQETYPGFNEDEQYIDGPSLNLDGDDEEVGDELSDVESEESTPPGWE